jgi:hypothetical protein
VLDGSIHVGRLQPRSLWEEGEIRKNRFHIVRLSSHNIDIVEKENIYHFRSFESWALKKGRSLDQNGQDALRLLTLRATHARKQFKELQAAVTVPNNKTGNRCVMLN